MSWLFRVARPALFAVSGEAAHDLTLRALRTGLVPGNGSATSSRLAQSLFGLSFPNPIGLAAGFDKNAEVPDAMLRLGFGFVECGSVTPKAQPGNPRPRLFRLERDRAVINRLGFNNHGHAKAVAKLEHRRGNHGIVGINLGANKDAADRIADYVEGYRRLAPLASYVTINVSSPNTPGLRGLQNPEELGELLSRVTAARIETAITRPILLKVAPDLDDASISAIVEACIAHGIDGLIVSNTTLARPATLRGVAAKEAGGLSGQPLFEPSTRALAVACRAASGRLPLIGVGGISSGADAYAKIAAGARLVQLYTAMIYEGPGLPSRIVADLDRLLARDGVTVETLCGRDAQRWAAAPA